MFHIFTQIIRAPSRSNQLISRSFCYKPINRKVGALLNQIFDREQQQKKSQQLDYNFTFGERIRRKARSGRRSIEIIKALPADSKSYTAQSLIDVYDRLSVEPISDEALVHVNFDGFIDGTEFILPKLSTSQIVHIFKQTARAYIPMFDELTETIANTLLLRIQHKPEITIDEIIDVDFALRKYYARDYRLSRLFEMLRLSTCIVFTEYLEEELIERQDYKKLMRIIRYLSNNPILMESIDTRLFDQLLLEDDHQFEPNDVVCTIVTLARLPKLHEPAKQLLTKMYRIWCSNTDHIDDVKKILKLLATKTIYKSELPFHFRDALFIQHCTDITIEYNDMRTAFDVLGGMIELNFTNSDLIEFLSHFFNTNKYYELKKDDYATFCIACEKADYKPLNWDSKVVPVMKRVDLESSNITKHVDLALALHKLEIYNDDFLEHFFHTTQLNEFNKHDLKLLKVFDVYKNRNDDVVTKPGAQNIVTPYMSWLAGDFEQFIGANKVLHNVTVSNEFTVPLVMRVNTKTGTFMDMIESSEKHNLMCNKNELIIGVLTQDIATMETNKCDTMTEQLNKQRKIIKDKGWVAITLDKSLYGSMETYKRAFTFFKIIVYAINNRARK